MEHLLHLTEALALERAGSARLQQQCETVRLNGSHDSENHYVLVLIDGNELIFRNNLLSQGDQGGRRAAQALFQTTNEYAFSTIDTLSVSAKIIVRVYVDLEDLCNLCLRDGLVNNGTQIKSFVRGFCQDRTLFDLIDVGMKGRSGGVVWDKIEGSKTSLPLPICTLTSAQTT